MSALVWTPATTSQHPSAQASERTTYFVYAHGDEFMAVAIVANANRPGSVNYNVGQTPTEAEAVKAAQLDWDSGARP